MSDLTIRDHLLAVNKAMLANGGALTFGIFGVELTGGGLHSTRGIDRIADVLTLALERKAKESN